MHSTPNLARLARQTGLLLLALTLALFLGCSSDEAPGSDADSQGSGLMEVTAPTAQTDVPTPADGEFFDGDLPTTLLQPSGNERPTQAERQAQQQAEYQDRREERENAGSRGVGGRLGSGGPANRPMAPGDAMRAPAPAEGWAAPATDAAPRFRRAAENLSRAPGTTGSPRPAPEPEEHDAEMAEPVPPDEVNPAASEGDGGTDGETEEEMVFIDRATIAEDGTPLWNGVPVTEGKMFAKEPDTGRPIGQFPLRHTEVTAAVAGMLSSVTVQQTYGNDFEQVIEAVYVFPLPHDAAVNEFIMTIGDRRIHGFIRERAEAERMYEEARAAGYTAALLTQERPNIFTQHVANIPPEGEVQVSIRYVAPLSYENGEYEFHFPMVVAPRYIPGTPEGQVPQIGGDSREGDGGGGGTSPDTDQVPDASHITPPVSPTRTGHDIMVRVDLNAGLGIEGLESVNHEVLAQQLSDSHYRVALNPADTIPNKDFVLRYRVAGDLPKMAMITHSAGSHGGGYFMLMVQPPEDPSPDQIMAREVNFIVDVSGSMRGNPLNQGKALMHLFLNRLRPDDAFNIITFAGGSSQLAGRALDNSPQNVERAHAFVDSLSGGGGTEMMAALNALASTPRIEGRMRIVVFITDGLIGNERGIIETIRNSQENDTMARFFSMGVGSSPNRHLMDGIAAAGNGTCNYISLYEDPNRAAERFYRHIDAPVLFNIRLDWGGLQVDSIYPERFADLWAGQPIRMVGRYTAPGEGTLHVRALRGNEELDIPVPVVLPGAGGPENPQIPAVWARQQIRELNLQMGTDEDPAIVDQIRNLALEYGLMSKYTAFIAIDSSQVHGDGNPLRVIQPVEFPDGMDWEGTMGEGGKVASVAQWGLVLADAGDGSVQIAHVIPGSAADRAGLRPNTRLWAYEGTQVNNVQHLGSLMLQEGNPSPATVQVREGEQTREVTLGE